MSRNFDLREALNAVSDVVINRPPPLREFDQIYMKVADMVIQAHYISERFDNKDLVFIGDGDAIGLSVMHLATQGIFNSCPRSVTLLDFDERIVNSVKRFSEKYNFSEKIDAYLYNVIDPLPRKHFGTYDAFYTNPPWGASNNGESVFVFLERGIEATKEKSEGAIVIADDPELQWTQQVLLNSQKHASLLGFSVAEMIPEMHLYHLDDDPNLKSCTCLFRRVDNKLVASESKRISHDRLEKFYGRESPLIIRYVKANPDLNYGKANDNSYHLVPME